MALNKVKGFDQVAIAENIKSAARSRDLAAVFGMNCLPNYSGVRGGAG